MALTQFQRQTLDKLLDQIKTVQSWLDDTGYPRQSRANLDEAERRVREAFAEQLNLPTPPPKKKGGGRTEARRPTAAR